MLLFLLTLLFIFVTTNYIYKYIFQWRHIEKFPGPRPYPIFGNAPQLGKSPPEILNTLLKWWRQYGCNTFRFWIANKSYIFITDPKDIEVVLTSNTLLYKGDVYNMLYNWIGKGLLTSHGQKWFKHRKMITPSFHFKVLNEFLDTITKNSSIFVKILSTKANTGEIFDFQDMVHYCTLDTICETAMGTEINAMINQDSELIKAFQDMCYVIQNRSFTAWKRSDFLYNNISEDSRTEKKALKILKNFVSNMINKRAALLKDSQQKLKKTNDDGVKRRQAFLDTLLTSHIDGRPLTFTEIDEEVQTFIFEKKVFQEQKQIFDHNLDSVPTYQDMQEMKYLDLVIKESQRLYPSVPIILRFTETDIELNGKLIPAGTNIGTFIIATGYNEKYFEDPYKFDPERFNKREGASPFEYVPFSAGPRNCIGQKFAVMEIKSIVSNIVRNFEILPPSADCLKNGDYEKLATNEYDPNLATVLTLKSVNGVQIRLKHRNK